ncbi:MAG: GNAT family N-acetyltransferase [Saprospiraceae bacterium]
MPLFHITQFDQQYTEAICQLILNIQQNEFNVPITLADQPDLLTIPDVYQQNAGNFWVAIADGEVVGSIGLIDCGEGIGCIRKMFVRADWRGKGRGVAQKLLDTLEAWAVRQGLHSLYLGTVERLHAAIRFYERNGFTPVVPEALPVRFPRMSVDTHFFWKGL